MLFEIPEGNAQYDDWARECGYFILAFGHLEGLTHSLERHALGEVTNEDLESGSRPRPRLDALIDAANAMSGEQHWRTIVELLREMKSLAKVRNLIVHNGLAVGSERGSTGEPKLVVHIRSTKMLSSGTRIDYARLTDYRVQAMELHRKLAMATMLALGSDQLARLERAHGGEDQEDPTTDDRRR